MVYYICVYIQYLAWSIIVTISVPTVTLSQLYGELSCGKQQLTEEEFLECVSTFLAHQNVARRKQQSTATQAMIDTMFLALDVDDKGYLSPKEWEVLFYMWNFPDIETCAVEAFKGADKNKDGQISLEEFQDRALPNCYIRGGGKLHIAPPKAVHRAAKRRSVRAKRGKIFWRVLFSDQKALS